MAYAFEARVDVAGVPKRQILHPGRQRHLAGLNRQMDIL